MPSLADLLPLNRWSLRSADPAVVVEITGERRPDDGIESSQAPVIATSSTAGSSAPAVQWVASGPRMIRFKSSFVADNFLVDNRPKKRALERLRAQDPTLGRAPRVTFSWGDDTITGFLTGDPVIRVNGYWATGFPKIVSFELEIMESLEVVIQGVDQAIPAGETQHLILVDGESFEELGRRYLGRPLKGELIRRINPEIAGRPEQAGDRVRVFEREHPEMRGNVFPTSVPFLDRDRAGRTWQPVVDALARERGTSDAPGLPWNLLPEVVNGELSP